MLLQGECIFGMWGLSLTGHIPTYFLPDVSGRLCAWRLSRRFLPLGFSTLTCCRRSKQGTWIHFIGRGLHPYNSASDELFCELERTEKLFLRYLRVSFILFLSRHSSSIANALFSVCYVLSSAFLISASVQKARSSAYSKHLMPGMEFSSPVRSFMYRLNKVQLVTAPCGSPGCKMSYLE